MHFTISEGHFLVRTFQIIPDLCNYRVKIRLIRNATMQIVYGSVRFVTDPLFARKLTMKSYAGISPNPLVDLPIPPEHVLSGAEFVLLSHIHSDHFDSTAQQLVPAEMPIYCQPPDLERISELGFSNVIPVESENTIQGVRIIRTPGSHGRGAVCEEMGAVSGFVLSTAGEPRSTGWGTRSCTTRFGVRSTYTSPM